MKRGLLPHLCELLLWHRLGQLVVELENSLEVVKNILTGNCVKTSERYHKGSKSQQRTTHLLHLNTDTLLCFLPF